MHTVRGIKAFAIVDQSDETPTTRTVRMNGRLDAQPGQFIMVWVPGTDEFPMSVSHTGDRFGITYKVIGEGTERLSRMVSGDRLGVRGPYGRGFTLAGKRILVVAGGTGMACLAPLVEKAAASGVKVDVVLGARTKLELLMEERCKEAGAAVHVTTDDGTEGLRGVATDMVATLMDKDGYDQLYACGPERMIVGVLERSRRHATPMQASLERYMKCGIGVCDSCAVDGMHVCVDGPVFATEELSGLTELGKTKLSPSGARTPL